MWVNKALFQRVLDDNREQQTTIRGLIASLAMAESNAGPRREQKAKDDMTIDWMRHRVNALEKLNAILLGKAAGVHIPIPEIVPTRPGSISNLPLDMSFSPSFEDPGDSEAARLGIHNDDAGEVTYTK